MIWVSGEAEYFFKQDWTGQIRLNCFNKLGFRRKALGTGFRCAPTRRANRHAIFSHFLTLLASILIDVSSNLVVNALSTANGFSMPR